MEWTLKIQGLIPFIYNSIMISLGHIQYTMMFMVYTMYILVYRRIYFYKVTALNLALTLALKWKVPVKSPSESPSIYQYIASIYMVHGSIYMVDCSIYHVFLYIPCSLLYIPCSLLYIHGSLLYIPCFPRKKRICKIMYNLGIRTHDLMQTARPR